MSSSTEDQLSPEERLLKVIQGNEGDTAEASISAHTSADADVPVKVPPKLRPKPLKPAVAKPAAASSPLEKPAEGMPEDDAVPVFGDINDAAPMMFADLDGASADSGEEPAEVEPSKSRRQFGISIVNTCIAALLVFAIVVIVAYETIAAVYASKQGLNGISAGALPPLEEAGTHGQLPDIQELLASFRERGFLTQQSDEVQPAVERPRANVSSLKQYVREHVVILGISWDSARTVQEAILMDQSGPRMHIVKPDEEIALGDGTVKIVRISEDSVIVHDGVEEIIIGKKKP